MSERRSRNCALCGHRYIPSITHCWCGKNVEPDELSYYRRVHPRRFWWAWLRFRYLIPIWSKLDQRISSILYRSF